MSEDSDVIEARRAALLAGLDEQEDAPTHAMVNNETNLNDIWRVSFPVCIAQTVDTQPEETDEDGNFFRDLKWSADGSTVVATRARNIIESYKVTSTLSQQPQHATKTLQATSYHRTPTNIHATAITTLYSEEPSYLVSCADMPIRLISPTPVITTCSEVDWTSPGECQQTSSPVVAKFPLIHAETERYEPAYSLLPFSSYELPLGIKTDRDRQSPYDDRLWVGSDSFVSLFDLSRPNEPPVKKFGIDIKARRAGSSPGFHGPVSALALSSLGTLAAGTYHRAVALYDPRVGSDTIQTWSLSSPAQTELERGTGVTSCLYSPDGQYLFIAERNACAVQVWDVRRQERLGFLSGREAKTAQRMAVTLIPSRVQDAEFTILTMGTSGNVQVYQDPILDLNNGIMHPSATFRAHNDSAAALALHPTYPTYIATASGRRSVEDTDISSSSSDSSSSESDEVNADDDVLIDQTEISGEVEQGKSSVPRREHTLKLWLVPSIDHF